MTFYNPIFTTISSIFSKIIGILKIGEGIELQDGLNMPIFISYSHKDSGFATQLIIEMEKSALK